MQEDTPHPTPHTAGQSDKGTENVEQIRTQSSLAPRIFPLRCYVSRKCENRKKLRGWLAGKVAKSRERRGRSLGKSVTGGAGGNENGSIKANVTLTACSWNRSAAQQMTHSTSLPFRVTTHDSHGGPDGHLPCRVPYSLQASGVSDPRSVNNGITAR